MLPNTSIMAKSSRIYLCTNQGSVFPSSSSTFCVTKTVCEIQGNSYFDLKHMALAINTNLKHFNSDIKNEMGTWWLTEI